MNELKDLLGYDPLADAEKITGTSYKENDGTVMLGMLMAMDHNRVKEAALDAAGDTTHRMTLDEYLVVVTAEGFEEVLRVPFHSSSSKKDEVLYILFKASEAVLLVFDTYLGKVNGGSFYYNVRPHDPIDWRSGVTSSGSFNDGVWYGHHDCREAVRHHMMQLREWGEFLTHWTNDPFMWLLHHQDTKDDGYDYKSILAERIAMLPEYVREAIMPTGHVK